MLHDLPEFPVKVLGATKSARITTMVRSIIDADNKVDASADVVRYRIKPHKIFLFTRDDEGVRIPFEVK